MKSIRHLVAKIRQLGEDRRGSMAWFMAAAAVPLVGAIGLSVDSARGYLVKARLSQAIDAAGLAGGRVMLSPTRDDDIRMFFKANFPTGFMGATVDPLSISADANNENLTISATATLDTTFMRVVGRDSMTVKAQTVVNRQTRGMELVLVMDNTGSMASNGKITAMKSAAADLVNILYNNKETIPNFWVGLVPYVAVVNIGTNHAAWTNVSNPPTFNVASMTRSNNAGTNPQTATVCVTTATDFFPLPSNAALSGLIVDVAGANQPEYNGRFLIRAGTGASTTGCTINSGNWRRTFWYVISPTTNWYALSPVNAMPATPATGTITIRRPPPVYTDGTSWKGCVEARSTPYEEDQAEALPGTAKWTQSYWPSTIKMKFYDSSKQVMSSGGYARSGDNSWSTPRHPSDPASAVDETYGSGNNAHGPNLGCGPPILPLQTSRTAALAAINTMQPWSRGGTMANVGLAWGWRTLSPAWRGTWGDPSPANLPLDYDTPYMDKVVVLLTDGVNEWYDWDSHPPGCSGISTCGLPSDADYTAYGRLAEQRLGTSNNSTATSTVNSRMLQLCTAMKQKNIIMYTIVLQENTAATQQLFRDCASKPEYAFFSPTAADLALIFKTIGNQLSNLRLAQ